MKIVNGFSVNACGREDCEPSLGPPSHPRLVQGAYTPPDSMLTSATADLHDVLTSDGPCPSQQSELRCFVLDASVLEVWDTLLLAKRYERERSSSATRIAQRRRERMMARWSHLSSLSESDSSRSSQDSGSSPPPSLCPSTRTDVAFWDEGVCIDVDMVAGNSLSRPPQIASHSSHVQ